MTIPKPGVFSLPMIEIGPLDLKYWAQIYADMVRRSRALGLADLLGVPYSLDPIDITGRKTYLMWDGTKGNWGPAVIPSDDGDPAKAVEVTEALYDTHIFHEIAHWLVARTTDRARLALPEFGGGRSHAAFAVPEPNVSDSMVTETARDLDEDRAAVLTAFLTHHCGINPKKAMKDMQFWGLPGDGGRLLRQVLTGAISLYQLGLIDAEGRCAGIPELSVQGIDLVPAIP